MASINKNDNFEKRRNGHGKGDLHCRGGEPGFWDSSFWGKSDCCGAPIVRIGKKAICDKCNKPCVKVEEE